MLSLGADVGLVVGLWLRACVGLLFLRGSSRPHAACIYVDVCLRAVRVCSGLRRAENIFPFV